MNDIDAAINKSWVDYNNYLNSKENREKCKPYLLECQRLDETVKRYTDQCQQIFEKLNAEVVREQYAVGGDLHRGFYCPSPVFDIVIGNTHRGKLLKRLTIRSHPSHTYRYNKDDRMILVTDQYNRHEIILRNGNVETGILFYDKGKISSISECIYDGNRIQSYVNFLYSSYNIQHSRYDYETYEYSTEGLKSADLFEFSDFRNKPALRHSKYIFQHDEEGYLSHYTSVEFDMRDMVKEDAYWKNHTFDVYIKRKV